MKDITFEKLMRKTKTGEIFYLEYYKGNDYSQENSGCFRRGVKKHLKGGKLNYDPIKAKNIVCFNMGKNKYRAIKFDNVIEAHIGKDTFKGPMHPDNFAKRMEEIDQRINNINQLTKIINK